MKLVSRTTNALGVILQKLLSELLYQLNENVRHMKVEDLNLILKDTFIKNICTSFLSANEFCLKIFRSVIVSTFQLDVKTHMLLMSLQIDSHDYADTLTIIPHNTPHPLPYTHFLYISFIHFQDLSRCKFF